MQLCLSGDLAGLIKAQQQAGSRLPPPQIWAFAFQLSDALLHMQERNMMHRDIKPANVFLGEDGTLKLGDLGLGRSFSSRTLEATTVVGTPYYMAPEVMKGSPYSYPADIWSLGCVVYELCNLVSPFWEKNLGLYQLYQKISSGVYAPVDEGYGPDMRAFVDAMIKIDVSARPNLAQVRAACAPQAQA